VPIADTSAPLADLIANGRRWFFQLICSTDRCPGPILSGSEDWSSRLGRSATANFVSLLRRALRILLLNGQSSGGQAAKPLPMHRRTLNRHLKVQGTTFQQVLDEIRFAAASQLLENTRSPLTEIAASLVIASRACLAARSGAGPVRHPRASDHATGQTGCLPDRCGIGDAFKRFD
jgi:AraC-like DNA-binding protein